MAYFHFLRVTSEAQRPYLPPQENPEYLLWHERPLKTTGEVGEGPGLV